MILVDDFWHWKWLFLLFFVVKCESFAPSRENREFVLDLIQPCRNGGPYRMQCTVKSFNITKNRITVDGDVIVLDDQNPELQVMLKYRRCEMKKERKCGPFMDYVLPKVCVLVSDFSSVFGLKPRNFFVPKWECPVKAGSYKIQIDISLKPIVRLPLSNTRYETKFVFQDAGKKKAVGCIETIWWMKDLGNGRS